MTEAEWDASADPLKLFHHLRGRPLARMSRWFLGLGTPGPVLSERKLRLFLCAWFRDRARSYPAEYAAVTAEVADLAENEVAHPTPGLEFVYQIDLKGLRAARHGVERDVGRRWFTEAHGLAMALTAAGPPPERSVLAALYGQRDNPVLAAAVRCLFEDPFRRPGFDPHWRTEAVVGLARTIYAGRAFDRLPILADALEEAGCDDGRALAHCRSGGPHHRGCWVVDLVLGHA